MSSLNEGQRAPFSVNNMSCCQKLETSVPYVLSNIEHIFLVVVCRNANNGFNWVNTFPSSIPDLTISDFLVGFKPFMLVDFFFSCT